LEPLFRSVSLLGICRSRSSQRLVLILLLLIASVPVYSDVGLAQSDNNPIVHDHVKAGAKELREYCAQCHGDDGTGNGPVASELKRKPANLTVLSKNDDGVFPTREVHDFIVGTREIPAHGTREMPVWGCAFMFRPGAMAGPFVPRAHSATVGSQDQLARRLGEIDPAKMTKTPTLPGLRPPPNFDSQSDSHSDERGRKFWPAADNPTATN
jgi:hypothetical protein